MQVTPIEKNNDTYRWRYAMNLFKNPTIFLTVAKVMLLAIVISTLLIGIITIIADGFDRDSLKFVGQLFLIMLGIFAVLLVLGYLIYAAIMGGHYTVDFEMNDKILVHAQVPKQARKAEAIGVAAMIGGLIAHSRGAISAGFNSATRTITTVQFDRVKKVVVDKKHSVIKLHCVGWDHAYADGDDFDLAADWIRAHTPESAEWVVKS